MRKLLFGCALMISGMVGAAGFLISGAVLIEKGAWSTLFNVFSKPEGIAALLFLLTAVVGGVVAALYLKEGK